VDSDELSSLFESLTALSESADSDGPIPSESTIMIAELPNSSLSRVSDSKATVQLGESESLPPWQWRPGRPGTVTRTVMIACQPECGSDTGPRSVTVRRRLPRPPAGPPAGARARRAGLGLEVTHWRHESRP
jgi:hypothetical protein